MIDRRKKDYHSNNAPQSAKDNTQKSIILQHTPAIKPFIGLMRMKQLANQGANKS